MFFRHLKGVRVLGCQRVITLCIVFKAKQVSKISLLANYIAIFSTTYANYARYRYTCFDFLRPSNKTDIIEQRSIANMFHLTHLFLCLPHTAACDCRRRLPPNAALGSGVSSCPAGRATARRHGRCPGGARRRGGPSCGHGPRPRNQTRCAGETLSAMASLRVGCALAALQLRVVAV